MIASVGGFYSHSDCCKFLPANWKDKEENYLKYRCDKGHDLYYMDADDLRKLFGYGYYEIML